jgi:phage tail sheath protein FI
MSEPTFGITISRVDNDPRPAITSDMSVVGLVGPMAGADAAAFPLNTPVAMFSDDPVLGAKLGNANAIGDAIDGINDQLGDYQVAARVVVVRTDPGADEAAAITNIVGSSVAGSGVHALKRAGELTGLIPRMIGIPDFTEQHATGEANAVVAELPAVLSSILAHAVVEGGTDSLQAFTDWRETMQSERLIPHGVKVKVGATSTVHSAVGRILGIGVRRDHEFGGRPFHSWANQPVSGIVGPARNVGFSLTDGANEGQAILAENGGIIARGQMGVESAIASGGFVYIGTDTAAEDDLWRFYNVTRGRDYIHLALLRTLRFYLGRFNITAQTIQAILNTMGTFLRDLKADGDILGYTVGFSRDQNSPENIRLGRFNVGFAAEEAPVLRRLDISSARYRTALDLLLNDLVTQANSNVALAA